MDIDVEDVLRVLGFLFGAGLILYSINDIVTTPTSIVAGSEHVAGGLAALAVGVAFGLVSIGGGKYIETVLDFFRDLFRL